MNSETLVRVADQDVPVLLLIFNRAEQVRGLVNNLRQVKPGRIFVSADGARMGHPDDIAKVAAARAVVEEIDWDCEVLRRFSEANEGCRYGPTHGIDWFFSQVAEGIILEDDIRFDPSFFRFAADLLERFRQRPEVSCICGYQFIEDPDGGESYRFTRIPLTWGWATWKDRWRAGQVLLNDLTGALAGLDLAWLPSNHDRRDIRRKLREAFHEDHVWDFLWMYAVWKQAGVAVVPSLSLTGNEGVGEDATHTRTATDFIHCSIRGAKFPLIHPVEVRPDLKADLRIFQKLLHTPSFGERLRDFLRNPSKCRKIIEMVRIRAASKWARQ